MKRIMVVVVILATLVASPSWSQQASPESRMRRELWVAGFVDDMLKQPDRLIYLVEASTNPKRAESWRGYDKFTIQVPKDIAQAVGGGLGFSYNLWKEYGLSSGREEAKERIRNYYNRNPGEFYEFAQRAFDSLVKSDGNQSIVEKEFTKIVKKEYTKGGIIPHDAAMPVLINHAPTNTVVAPILQDLKNQSSANLKKILSSEANLKKFIESRFGKLETSLDNNLKFIETSNKEMQDLLKQIIEESASNRSIEKQQAQFESEARERRAGVFIASNIIGIFDPQGGQLISVIGNAGLDTYTAISDIAANGISLVSSATLVGAGLAVAQLFMKSTDPAAERHKQLVGMLQEIGEDIKAIRVQLGRMEVRLITMSENLAELREGQIGSAQLSVQKIQSLHEELVGIWVKQNYDNQENLQQSFRDSVVECFNSYTSRKVFVVDPLTTEGAAMRTCLSKSETFGLSDAKGETFTGSSNHLTKELLPEMLKRPYDYLGMLPAAVALLGDKNILVDRYAIPVYDISDLTNIVNPIAWATGASAFVELRLLVPEFRWPEEKKIVTRLLNEGRRAKKALSIINLLRSGDAALVKSKPSIKGRKYRLMTAWTIFELEVIKKQFIRKKSQDNSLAYGLSEKFYPILERTPQLSLRDFELIGSDLKIFEHKITTWMDKGVVSQDVGYQNQWEGCFNRTSDLVWHASQSKQPDFGKPLHRYRYEQWCGKITSHSSIYDPRSLDNTPELKAAVDEEFEKFKKTPGNFVTRDLLREANAFRVENDAWSARYQTLLPVLEISLDQLREEFSLYVSAQLVTNNAPRLSGYLDQADLGLYLWEFLERVGGADCFWANPSMVAIFYGNDPLLSGADFRKAAEKGVNFLKSGIIDKLRFPEGVVRTAAESDKLIVPSRAAVAEEFSKSAITCRTLPKVFEQTMNKLTEYEAFLTRATVQ